MKKFTSLFALIAVLSLTGCAMSRGVNIKDDQFGDCVLRDRDLKCGKSQTINYADPVAKAAFFACTAQVDKDCQANRYK